MTGDPSVAVGPDGRWYLGMLGGQRAPVLGPVEVTTSLDGVHWSTSPAVIAGSHPVADSDSVAADPAKPGRAYVTWAEILQGEIWIAMTSDGGATFSPPHIVDQVLHLTQQDEPRLVVLTDGSLLDVYQDLPVTTNGPSEIWAKRGTVSADGDVAWSPKVQVGSDPPDSVTDPGDGTSYEFTPAGQSVVAGPGNTAEVAWTTTSGSCGATTTTPTGAGHVCITRYDGAGWSAKDWSAPTGITRTGVLPFQATVAAAADGTLALSWYDFGAVAADGTLPTTRWYAASFDGGRKWSVPSALACPFDLRSAGVIGGGWLGDYQSLVPTPSGGGFEAAFTLAKPQAQFGPTGIVARTVRAIGAPPECAHSADQPRPGFTSGHALLTSLPETAAGRGGHLVSGWIGLLAILGLCGAARTSRRRSMR